MDDILSYLYEVAESKHGVLLVSDARGAGMSPTQLRHHVDHGDFDRPTRRVLRIPGAPRTVQQRVMTAVLDASPGAFGCGTTSVALWGLPGFDLNPIHLVRQRGMTGRRTTLATVHEVVDLLPHHVAVLDGIPVVRPERAIFELCGSVHPKRAERALDNAWSRGLLSGRSLRRVHAELSDRGRAGTVVLRELLERRPDDYVPPASNVEGRFIDIIEQAGLPKMRRQVDCGGDRWVGRVDFLAEDRPLIVEVQSERFHKALIDTEDDARRIAALRDAGFAVIEVTDEQVWRRPREVIEAVRAA